MGDVCCNLRPAPDRAAPPRHRRTPTDSRREKPASSRGRSADCKKATPAIWAAANIPLTRPPPPACSLPQCPALSCPALQTPQGPPKARIKPPFPKGRGKSCPRKPPPNRRGQIPSLHGPAATPARRITQTERPTQKRTGETSCFPPKIYICPFFGYMPVS